VQLSARGLEPEPEEPEQEHGDQQPEAGVVRVEALGDLIADVEGEDDDGGAAAGGAEAADLLEVGDAVSAALGDGGRALAAQADAFKLREALDEGERQEEEDAEGGEPARMRMV